MRQLGRSTVLSLVAVVLARGSAVSQQHVALMPQLGMGSVTSVAYSPDGHFAVTGEMNKTARLWNLDSGLQLRAFTGHGGPVYAAAFSPDGKKVLTGSGDHTARLWDVATGKSVRTYVLEEEVRSVVFSKDGQYFLTGGFDRKAKLWETESGNVIRTFEPIDGAVSSVAISKDGSLVVTGDWSNTAQIWDAQTGTLLRTLKGHTDLVKSVAISLDGRLIATGSSDYKVKVWSAITGELVQTLAEKQTVNSVSFSPDGKMLASGTDDATVQLWDVGSGKSLKVLPGHIYGFTSVQFSVDGRWLLAGCGDGSLWQWDIANDKLRYHLQGQTSAVDAVAFSPDDKLIATGGGDSTARLWDLQTGQAIRTFDPHVLPVTAVAFSPDGKQLATAGDSTRLWNLASGELMRELATERTSSVAYSPDGRSVLTSFWQNGAKMWDVSTGEMTHELKGHTSEVVSVAYSHDGRSVLTASQDGTAKLWGASGGAARQTFGKLIQAYTEPDKVAELSWMNSVAFLPDGHFVLTGQGFVGFGEAPGAPTVAKLWDAVTGAPVRTFTGHTGAVTSAVSNASGRLVLTGSADQTARIWDASSGSLLHTLTGHTADVSAVTFSADGRFALTGSADTTARLWEAGSGRQLAALMSYADGSWVVTDRDGRFDASDLDGGAPLAWVADEEPMRALPLEIFMRDYYTPGLLSRVWKGEKLPPVRSIAEIRNRVQPEVKVVRVVASAKVAGRVDVVVRAKKVTDEKGVVSGLQDLRLFRDGQMVAGGYLEGALKDGEFTFRDVMLPSGAKTVTFTAYAFNSERIKSATASLEYAPKPVVGASAVQRRAFLVQIGVNHYAAEGCELNFSVNDAEKMSAALSERMKAQGLVVEPVVMTSEKGADAMGAAKEAIRRQLAAIAAQATPDDVFFLSFSGHGYSAADGEFYLLPSDVKGSCHGVTEGMLKSAISADELAEWLRPIDAGEMTFVLDACHSAESVEANGFKPGPMGSRGLGQLAYDKRMRILAASQSDATAQEYASLQQGLLSYVLTHDGLQEGKADWKPKDGAITLGEWLGYAANAVPTFTLDGGKASGSVNDSGTNASKTKGIEIEGQAGKGAGKAVQVPAIFDFSKKDTFRVQ
jgi:WD40 repeat protein